MREKLLFRVFDRFKTGNKCRAKLILVEDATIKNLSFGGVLLETTKRLNINNNYKIQMISNNNETITPMGLVVRASLKRTINKNNSILPLYQVALRFIELDDREKNFLDKLISKLE